MSEPCDACRAFITELEKRVVQMFTDRDAAGASAAASLSLRLHDMNGLHRQLLDQINTTITRREHDTLADRVSGVERALSAAKGFGTTATLVGWVITTMISFAALGSLLFHTRG